MASSTDSTPKASSAIPAPCFIDDMEPSPREKVADWLAMLAALALAAPFAIVYVVLKFGRRPNC